MKKRLKDLQFVQLKEKCLGGFGIIACPATTKEESYCIMLGDMDEDFGTWEYPINNIETVDDKTVRKNLDEMSKHKEKYPYFLIQLNDIQELKEYHVEEDGFLKNIRKTNEVCLYCKEQVR